MRPLCERGCQHVRTTVKRMPQLSSLKNMARSKGLLSLFDARIVNTETTLGLSVFLQDNRLAVAILGMGPVERECGKSWKKRSRRTSRVATV